MMLHVKRLFSLIGIIFLLGCTLAAAQNGPGARLIKRFEAPVSPGPSWEALRKATYGFTVEEMETVAIRICSTHPLLLSLPSAVNNPFEIADFFKSRFKNIRGVPSFYLLRSTDCVSAQVPNMYATEVWTLTKDTDPPPNVESYRLEDIKTLSLGFEPSKCVGSRIDYTKALDTLVARMKSDFKSFGVVIGYHYFEKEIDPRLKKKLTKIKAILNKSGLAENRYDVISEVWHADDSRCAGNPVIQPSIYFVTKRF